MPISECNPSVKQEALPKKTYPASMPCINGSVELILEQKTGSIVYDFQSRFVGHNRG